MHGSSHSDWVYFRIGQHGVAGVILDGGWICFFEAPDVLADRLDLILMANGTTFAGGHGINTISFSSWLDWENLGFIRHDIRVPERAWSSAGFSGFSTTSAYGRSVFLPDTLILLACATLFAFRLRRFLKWRRIENWRSTNRCTSCGYDLRASKDRCPECGLAFAPGHAEAPNATTPQ
jgi:hypothetical protein